MAEWEGREWNYEPCQDLDRCMWSGGASACRNEVVAHTPSRNSSKGVINLCETHAARAREQVERGTRPWLKEWVLLPEGDTDAVARGWAEVARAR